MFRTAILATLSLALWGCPKHLSFGKDGEVRSPEELLKRVKGSESLVQGLRGDAKLKVETDRGSTTLTLFVSVDDQARLRLDALDFFGRPQGSLVCSGGRFGLWAAEEARYYRGPASAQNIARFFPVPWPPEELAGLLLGRVPRLSGGEAAMRVDPDQGAYVVALSRGGEHQTLRIDTVSERVVESRSVGRGSHVIAFESYQEAQGVAFPGRLSIQLEEAGKKTRLVLTYKDVVVNPPADLLLYELAPPANVPVVEVDERGFPSDAGGRATP